MKTRVEIESEVARLQRWIEQHPAPKVGDKDVNPQYHQEYATAAARLDALKEVLPLIPKDKKKPKQSFDSYSGV